MGVLIVRIIVFRGLYWGSTYLGTIGVVNSNILLKIGAGTPR